ncbi:MAG: hypothetical protein FJ110_19270 [Deltaproteobacteria bacterium]|nr:hypothetical protein [Deltaproteobacteria bacterium]
MNRRMKAVLESKRQERERLRALPLNDKIAMLERLRDRALRIGGTSLFFKGQKSGVRSQETE